MTKIRKVQRRKKFRVNVNRKRQKNRQRRPGKVQCQIIQQNWDKEKSVQRNLEEMGLVYDPNKDIKSSKLKNEIISEIKATSKWDAEYTTPTKPSKTNKPTKEFVCQELEKEAKAPRKKRFRLPKSQVEWLTALLDKYGTDYKAMVKDKTNYYQKTWKQIRRQIKVFKKIPEQYSEYLKSRQLTEIADNEEIHSDSD